MTLRQELVAFVILGAFVAMVLFVIVGQLTVRRLRKNPETKQFLGMEFASGWDILNVTCALSRPKWFSEIMRNSPLSFTAADERLLYKNTSRFERVLARMFFLSWASTGALMLAVIVLSGFGIID